MQKQVLADKTETLECC